MSRLHALGRTVVALGIVSLLTLTAPLVSAGGNGAFTDTQILHDVTQTFPTDSMCGSPAGTVTVTVNAVMHVTVNGAGDVGLTVTQEGRFLLVPTDPTLPSFAGHFTNWFGLSDNNRNSVQHGTFSARGTATDGSGATIELHAVSHASISAGGQVNLFMDCH